MVATPARRRAFTLVELLVVVGIISVLIAVLMPALSRAREHANRVKCAANLRTMGQALALYTHQYGCYPGCFLSSNGSATYSFAWPVRLRPFVGGDRRILDCPSQGERCEWTDGAPGPVERAVAGHDRYGYELGERLLTWQSYFSYGYNAWGTGSPGANAKGLGDVFNPSNPLWAQWPELRANRVVRPAEMIAIADSTADGMYDPFIGSSGDPTGKHVWPGRIHGGGANVLFCDGHVQWYAQEELIVPPSPSGNPSYYPKSRMWNFDHRAH
jgi:prepilin-type processing-associated H-X9-DG protein/prepilin-type N-terminal cleavage/methylation domain-containing protein